MKRPNYWRVIYFLIVGVTIYGILISLLIKWEGGAPGSKITHVQDAIWYLVATLTTVGYGDIYPVTFWGRNIGFIFLLSSLGVYGFIIGRIANFMSTIKENRELGLNGTSLKNHVVMLGWNDFGQSVISHLAAAGGRLAGGYQKRCGVAMIPLQY